jgi:hypothetical protein
MRINRIPTALRSVKIVDLIDKYAEQLDQPAPKQTTAAPQISYQSRESQIKRKPVGSDDPTRQRGTKRSRHVTRLFLTKADPAAAQT